MQHVLIENKVKPSAPHTTIPLRIHPYTTLIKPLL